MAKVTRMLKTVEDVEAAFYEAIRAADLEAMMSLWADDDEIVCVHPGSQRLIGHAAIRASWATIFEHGGISIRPVQMHTMQNLMVSVHNVVEQIDPDDRHPPDMHVVACNVYLKTPKGWRIAVHHASVVPGKAPPDPSLPLILH